MRTKIIATLGPASNSPEKISSLIKAGVNIFRLNFSHGDHASFASLIDIIREAERAQGSPITIMQDLAGPKIRLGKVEKNSIQLEMDDLVYLGVEKPVKGELPFLPFDHPAVLKSLVKGDILALADGGLYLTVEEKHSDTLFTLRATNSGIVTSRKGLSLPGKSVPLPTLTDKDKVDLVAGLRLGVDAVAISYVQRPEDILEAKKLIAQAGRSVPVVAKLERQNAVDNLDAIIAVTDIIMVARGDLGIECPLQKLPAIQKRIIKACNAASKPVIVATQMLLSMVNNITPTRAETTDVANAVLDGADCVMLSEETAMGAYPAEAVAFMQKITTEAESFLQETAHADSVGFMTHADSASFMAHAACVLAKEIHARAIIAHSISGASGRNIARHRPEMPLYVLTPNYVTLRHLNFSWGITPVYVNEDMPGHLERAENFIDITQYFLQGDQAIITAGQNRYGEAPSNTNVLKIYTK